MITHLTDNWYWYALIWAAFTAGYFSCALFTVAKRGDDR
jgi:hypothetical protein